MPISRGRVFFLCLPLALSARDSAHIPPPLSAPRASSAHYAQSHTGHNISGLSKIK